MKIGKSVTKAAMFAAACGLSLAVSAAALSKNTPKGWGEDFTAACEEAKRDGKLVLLAFSGSDWCGWCIKMDKEIYSKPGFVSMAKRKFVLVSVDSPQDKEILSPLAKKQNPELVKKYGIEGYPSTIVVRPSGEEVKRFGGYRQEGVEGFLKALYEVAEAEGVGAGKAAAVDAKSDDRFFFAPADRAKVTTREMKQRTANRTNDFEIVEFAGISFGAEKSAGAPTLASPYRLLSEVQRPMYTSGKLTGFTLAAPPAKIKAMTEDELKLETAELVKATESDCGIRLAVASSKIDFVGKMTGIVVTSRRSSGTLTVQFKKKAVKAAKLSR